MAAGSSSSYCNFAILDEQGGRVEPGDVGELYLGGPCVGLGYFNETELTQNAFRQNPANHYYPERFYRTGDLGRIDCFWFPNLIETAAEKHYTDGFENQRDQQNQNKLRHKFRYWINSDCC